MFETLERVWVRMKKAWIAETYECLTPGCNGRVMPQKYKDRATGKVTYLDMTDIKCDKCKEQQ